MSDSLLSMDTEANRLLKLVKEFCSLHVYTSREALETEIGGLNAITSLLDRYKSIMLLPRGKFEGLLKRDNELLRSLPIESLLFSLLPEKHLKMYAWSKKQNETLEPVYRMQLAIDYISGMTDSHLLKIFNMVNGSQQVAIE